MHTQGVFFLGWEAVMERSQKVITAYHEAGHAVVAMANGFQVVEISNLTVGHGHGNVVFQHAKPSSALDRTRIITVFAAGAAADYLHWSKNYVEHNQPDGDSELCEGVISDQKDAEQHLVELGEAGRFWDYVSICIALLKHPDYWTLVEYLGGLLQNTSRINNPELLRRVYANTPKLTDNGVIILRQSLV